MKYCLVCRKDVSKDGYNPSYYGMDDEAIHYGYDWYCGPVIECEAEPSRQERNRLYHNYKMREYRAWQKRHKEALQILGCDA